MMCFKTVFILALLSTAVLPANAGTIEAFLDGTCNTINGAFTVPPGSVAVNFSAAMSSPWRACSVDYPIDTIGFMIVDGGNKRYYGYAQYKDGSSRDLEGNLATLSLGPGSYYVYVQGGLDTKVRLTFDVAPGKLILKPL